MPTDPRFASPGGWSPTAIQLSVPPLQNVLVCVLSSRVIIRGVVRFRGERIRAPLADQGARAPLFFRLVAQFADTDAIQGAGGLARLIFGDVGTAVTEFIGGDRVAELNANVRSDQKVKGNLHVILETKISAAAIKSQTLI